MCSYAFFRAFDPHDRRLAYATFAANAQINTQFKFAFEYARIGNIHTLIKGIKNARMQIIQTLSV